MTRHTPTTTDANPNMPHVTKTEIQRARRVYSRLYGPFTIPAGTPCQEATNLPPDPDGTRPFWVGPWEGMPADAADLIGGYGLLIEHGEVCEV